MHTALFNQDRELSRQTVQNDFHILTIGWDLEVIKRLADPLQAATGFTFSHVLDPSLDRRALVRFPTSRFHVLRNDVRMKLAAADRQKLAALERPGVRTIHNMIMGDARTKTLSYDEALDYASEGDQLLHQLADLPARRYRHHPREP